MSCSIEVLVIALQLARGLLVAETTPEYYMPPTTTLIYQRPRTELETAHYNLERAIKKQEAESLRLADFREFERLAGVCTPSRVSNAGVYEFRLPTTSGGQWVTGSGGSVTAAHLPPYKKD